jgi:nicotinamide riboside transporter PnuC
MLWGGKDEQEDAGARPWREPLAWLGCLAAVVMPTLMLTGLFQVGGRSVSPLFTPLLFIGLFTSMVLLVRPWTFR